LTNGGLGEATVRRNAFLAFAVAVLGLGQVGQGAEFLGLGIPFTEVHGVSADGKHVVGGSYDSAAKATVLPFRWSKSTGIVALPTDPNGEPRGSAGAATADGSIIVGYDATAATLNEAVRWVDGGAPFGLGDLAGGVANSEAVDVSFDGSVIVGKSVADGGVRAFRRTEANGLQSLSTLVGFGRSESFAVSGDGTTVVGSSSSTSPQSGLFGEAFRWTEAGGMKGLGHLPADSGFIGSVAYDASESGDVIVGVSSILQMAGLERSEAFRWTEESGMVGLGDLAGDGVFSSAYGVSADGSIIIGSGRTAAGERAFIWDDDNKMRDLQSVLVSEYGLGNALTNWTLQTATAISADGMILAGIGRNPLGQSEGWYVDLSAALVAGDANGDGKVDLTDFGILKSNFGSGTTLAQGDFTGDGKVDLTDFGILKSNFGQTGAAAVPEPSGLLLAGLGAAGAGLARRRRRTT
jgi:probable HAF family extracellular repeat protein